MGTGNNQPSKRGPLCGASNPGATPTRGSLGHKDAASPDDPVVIPRSPNVLAAFGAPNRTSTRKATGSQFNPNYTPFPLSEIGKALREQIFKAAAQCMENSTGKKPTGLDDKTALAKATVTPETTHAAWTKVIEAQVKASNKDFAEQIRKATNATEKAALERGMREMQALLRTKLKVGRALVDARPPRILISPKIFAAAQAGQKLPREGSARMYYRLVFLEEQLHIYLHLRGISVKIEVRSVSTNGSIDDQLDQLLKGTGGKQTPGSGSCHHATIPIGRRYYHRRFWKALGKATLDGLKQSD